MRRLPVAVVFAVVASLAAVSSAQAAPEEVGKQIDDLRVIVSAMPKDAVGDPDVQKPTRIAQAPREAPARASGLNGAANEDLRKQVEAIKNSITPFPKGGAIDDPKLRDALLALATALREVDCTLFKTAAVDCYIEIITEAIKKLVTAAGTTKFDNAQAKALAEAFETLDPLMPPPPAPSPVVSIHRAMYGDVYVISDFMSGGSGGKSPVRQRLATVPSLDDGNEDIPDSNRACSATQAMRTYCQKKQSCWAVDNGMPMRSGAHLCGYEPAPYADPITKRLVVEYQCVTKLDLSKKPTIDPAAEMRVAQFRLGETAKIICSGSNQ